LAKNYGVTAAIKIKSEVNPHFQDARSVRFKAHSRLPLPLVQNL
jgi:hypothetical protein